ncbi:hypothetical protein K437DRAFT_190743 [Tilletiaria anomala UBC 951]|uniref:Uncharacterized protein n=1 Tax=Tilletiaria anomala (strain ATCC 24038 / CBS 436.72 / UBC 951) TaxID=1037660 RepID=A0A066VNT2_TILAU|nr:uncharacterized protein K437DRAFT_190743 [Tilletiaria anomala UBC 951]KDN40245.1 hypothetical protein K437DRAFT_190743 [Tilletiaria anomala UBC 951]
MSRSLIFSRLRLSIWECVARRRVSRVPLLPPRVALAIKLVHAGFPETQCGGTDADFPCMLGPRDGRDDPEASDDVVWVDVSWPPWPLLLSAFAASVVDNGNVIEADENNSAEEGAAAPTAACAAVEERMVRRDMCYLFTCTEQVGIVGSHLGFWLKGCARTDAQVPTVGISSSPRGR